MAVTPNYGWPVPVATDYVKDGWEAISDLGNAIDTTVAGLGSGLTLVKSQTIGTTVSTVTVSNCFSSTYDNYRIIVSGGVGSTFLSLYYHLNGITTGWYSSYVYANYGSAAGGYANRSNQSNAFFGYGTANSVYTIVDLINPNKASAKSSTFTTGETSATGSSIFGSSYNASTTQATDLILTPSTGTLTGGTIYIFGYQK